MDDEDDSPRLMRASFAPIRPPGNDVLSNVVVSDSVGNTMGGGYEFVTGIGSVVPKSSIQVQAITSPATYASFSDIREKAGMTT